MKKMRYVIWVFIAVIGGLAVADVIAVAANQNKNLLDLTSEIVALLIATGSIALAILSQMNARRQENLTKRLIEKMREVDTEVDQDQVYEQAMQKKIDEVLKLDEKILKSVKKSGSKKKVE